jgi:hypothetical protein
MKCVACCCQKDADDRQTRQLTIKRKDRSTTRELAYPFTREITPVATDELPTSTSTST